jgi:MFS family permease
VAVSSAKLDFKTLKAIPASIWAIGFVSLFMDISSEMIHALLPIYMVTVLGASTLTIGIVEGIAEATASITKVFSGAISDWIGKRKLLAVIGYGLAAFTKPVFPLAGTIGWLIGARFLDRVGKGIRGAPRDALVSDIAPAHLRGASFGLRQSLDTIGAFLGPLVAISLMVVTANNFKFVFWIAVIPAFASLGLMMFAVKESPREKPELPSPVARSKFPLQPAHIGRLPRAFWQVVVVAGIFTLARFSEAFLILKAQAVGLPIALVPAIMVVMNIAYAASAYPAGVISDGKAGRNGLLLIGLAFLIAADLILALSSNIWMVLLGVSLWGLHMGFTQGLLAALVADTAPEDLRGTAYGMFNFISGIALLFASALAGLLWQNFGSSATFFTGAGLAALSAIGLMVLGQVKSSTA